MICITKDYYLLHRIIHYYFDKLIRHPSNKPPLLSLENKDGGRLQSDNLIVAYHRVHNIGNLLTYRKFHEQSTLVSTYLKK